MAELRDEIRIKIGDEAKVLFEGTADEVKALDKVHKSKNLIKAGLLSLIGIVLTVLYMVKTSSPSIVVGIIVLIAFLYAGFSEIIGCTKYKKMKYYITDGHIIADFDTNVNIIPIDKISSYRYSTDEDGHNSLVIGNVKSDDFKLRSIGITPARFDDDGTCKEAVLYAISDFENFKKIFEAQKETK